MTNKQLFNLLITPLFFLIGFQSTAQDLHRQNADLPCINKNFNVAIHIAVDSIERDPIATENLVNKMLEETSEYFSPLCISFSACEFLIIEDNYSYAHLQDAPIPVEQRIEKMESLFNKERRINLFIVEDIQNIDCGYGTFNGILTSRSANIVIELENCTDKKHSQNLSHQLGHLFGLYDTFNDESEIELFDGSNCETAGDFICDTPGDPYGKLVTQDPEENVFIVGNYQANCEFIFQGKDANGDYWQPDIGNMMSAYPCKCGFTREQYLKMAETYDRSNFKQF